MSRARPSVPRARPSVLTSFVGAVAAVIAAALIVAYVVIEHSGGRPRRPSSGHQIFR